ncbi:stretch-activated cation channel mid1 [Malassezia vespertilionis]|uniref:stretch-activated cation channel mid1 n=1 Tax=Malassezia vespertilionis TaxID=2020962 RepID=UPI0024B142CD|nr:stretch-activated cation channel mid1 [Malassezia vespertilionis]WFD07850.1 stretch-activated cation channel mid1 [Malassezia vespertilionis]
MPMHWHARLGVLVLLGLVLVPQIYAEGHSKHAGQESHKTKAPTGKIGSGNAVKTTLPMLTTDSRVNASTGLIPQPSSIPVEPADEAPYALHDSVMVRSDLSMSDTDGLHYTFAPPPNVPVYITLSLCAGPSIPPYNTSDDNLMDQLGMSADEARQATLVSLYVSDSSNQKKPGPDQGVDKKFVGYAQGGWSEIPVPKGTKDGLWIGVFPPKDPRGLNGTYRIQLAASTVAQLERVAGEAGVFYDDSDRRTALLTSFNYTTPAPNISLIVLPTDGDFSLASLTYFNSSFCAIFDAWSQFNRSPYAPDVNSSDTTRMTQNVVTRGDQYRDKKKETPLNPHVNDTAGMRPPGDPVALIDDLVVISQRAVNDSTDERTPQARKQFLVSDLMPGHNYTAYLVSTVNQTGTLARTLYPAVKFVTKTNPTCRLVYDLPFCPELAYSIPFNPGLSVEEAMSVMEKMISANYGNFSATLATFPCKSEQFGLYSSVATCDGCLRAYQNWLCAVAIPRCTDLIDPAHSVASQNGTELQGLEMPANTHLYPYVVNRTGRNSSRQAYIDQLFDPGDYGELLPCLSTCEMVMRSCPPLIDWDCPKWTVTAERDYGTFADADSDGLGMGENGGAGKDGARFGGAATRYVAQDAFGNVYCNAMDVDRLLRQASGAVAVRPEWVGVVVLSVVGALLW